MQHFTANFLCREMIVKLKAPLKNYIWGGTKLKTEWSKQTDLPSIAESWELSFVEDAPSVIASGENEGKALPAVATEKDFGENCRKFDFFPTLVKLIDTAQPLSIQVHPNDEYALEKENQLGKTEAWYILDAEKGAYLYLGLNKTLGKTEFMQKVENNTLCDCLNKVPVKKGDVFFVPSGTLHSIGAGITLLEVQQNSTLTYRVYDYDRVDNLGNKRQLHLQKASEVVNLQKYEVPSPERQSFLCGCRYFSAYRYYGEKRFKNSKSFTAVTVTDGQITLSGLPLLKGETAFVSAGETMEIHGNGEYVCVCVD